MALLDTIKNNSVKIVLGSSGSIIALVSAMFTIDARYAHAAEVDNELRSTRQIIQETTQTLRKQSLEDKVFELDLKKAQSKTQQLTPIDTALYERYMRQLRDIPSAK